MRFLLFALLLTGCSPKPPWTTHSYSSPDLTLEFIEVDEGLFAYLSIAEGTIPLYTEDKCRVWLQGMCFLCYPLAGNQKVLLPHKVRDMILDAFAEGKNVEVTLEGGHQGVVAASGTSLRGSTLKVIGNLLPPIFSSMMELSLVNKMLKGTLT